MGLVPPIFADTDHDGYTNDLFIGATGYDPPGRSGAGAIWLFNMGGTNAIPDVNVWKIDGYPDDQSLPVFSSTRDGNITIDVNVSDDSNYAILDMNYSTTSSQGTGTIIVNDLNLSTLPTSGAYHCEDTNFTNATVCSIDFNIASITDGNYYLLAALSDNTNTEFSASDASFMIDNTPPTLTILSPSNGSSSTETSVTLTYSASDSGAGVTSYSVSTNGSTYTDNGTNTSYTFTGLSEGAQTFYVKAADGAGNTIIASISITITVETTASTTGGGNLQGKPTPPSSTKSNPPTSERTATFIKGEPGTPITLQFHHPYLHPVDSITITSPESITMVGMMIESEGNFPALDGAKPCDYFFIATQGKALPTNMTAMIRFRVPKTVIIENNADPDDARLYHFIGKWEELPTAQVFETEEDYYYDAQTNGFSPFAIGIIPLPPEEKIITPNETAPEKPSREEMPIISSNETAPILPSNTSFLSNPSEALILILIACLGLLFAFHHEKRKNGKKKWIEGW
ncbi:MAG: PGF-pre-PGF domain-containing protein [Candidatus Diapherotrites archaeon]